jgi:hypothetical protein
MDIRLLLPAFVIVGGLALPGQANALDSKASATATANAQETVAASQTVSAEATVDAFRSQVSKAYMNCLFEADDVVEGLSNNPQARDAEEKAHRTFCLNRKESCIRLGNDADCRVFLEDFTE